MTSFFDKLKNSIGVESSDNERDEEKIPQKKSAVQKPPKKEKEIKKEESEESKSPLITEKPKDKKYDYSSQKWLKAEGQLAVDVLETPKSFIIQSTIAGIKSRDLDISVEKNLVTIKGERKNPRQENERSYLCQECYWGPFVREIIMPEEIDEAQIKATLKDGILILEIGKKQEQKGKKIEIAEE